MPDTQGKRRRANDWPAVDNVTGNEYHVEDYPLTEATIEDILSDSSLYALHDPFVNGLVRAREELNVAADQNKKKRNHSDIEDHTRCEDDGGELTAETQQWLKEQFPELFPAVPSIESRKVTFNVPNPFASNGAARHPKLRPATSVMSEDGAVSGLIKFRMRPSEAESDKTGAPRQHGFAQRSMAVHHRPTPNSLPNDNIPALPPGFGLGRKLQLDPTDSKLLKFCKSGSAGKISTLVLPLIKRTKDLVAFCSGRTLLTKTNGFYCDITPMAAENACVKHALLTLAATYMLDYLPSEQLRGRANWHYEKAVKLLDEGLKTEATREIGKEDAIIGALVLLNCDDLVNWELHQARNSEPNWYKGARTAKQILDDSDPGYRYWKPSNVQSSNARISCGNKVATYDIFSQTVMPLSPTDSKCSYAWLLEGSERDVRKIHGLTGLSSKLLHTFAQITHLAAQLKDTPDSVIIPLGAQKVRDRLSNFWQWSELSDGLTSLQDLFASCRLDSKGEVDCPTRVTELTGETYVAAAQIYLHCRLFRQPRRHPTVQKALANLLGCIERMPCNGPLFTAQAPLYSVFIGGLVAYREQDRSMVRRWFELVISGTRGNVPPAWRGLQFLWDWMDNETIEDEEIDDENPIGSRTPWWEDMAARLVLQEGRMNLA